MADDTIRVEAFCDSRSVTVIQEAGSDTRLGFEIPRELWERYERAEREREAAEAEILRLENLDFNRRRRERAK